MKPNAILAFPLLVAIRIYRWFISPAKSAIFGPTCGCRFTPSCSCYAEEALKSHGPFRGSLLTLKRLGRCHPWGDSGYDPVPPRSSRVIPTDAPPHSV